MVNGFEFVKIQCSSTCHKFSIFRARKNSDLGFNHNTGNRVDHSWITEKEGRKGQGKEDSNFEYTLAN